MSQLARKLEPTDDDRPEAPPPPEIAEASAWLGLLVRTLKTCRLYDEANPTVVRFREDLARDLDALLQRFGTLRLEVSPHALAVAGHPVHAGHAREENLAALLYRDGVRSLAFEAGIAPREVDAFVDRILQVSGPSAGDEDLVTLLWDADLPHVLVDTVPLEGDADGGGDDGDETTHGAAWPRQERGSLGLVNGGADGAEARSDDWRTGDVKSDLEVAFDDIEDRALLEIARFQAQADEEAALSLVEGMVRVMRDCLADDVRDLDRQELAGFLPRVLREAMGRGLWGQAAEALELLRRCRADWPVADFAEALCGRHAITTHHVVKALDRQEGAQIEAFLALARALGPDAGTWLMHVLAESQQMQVRRPLARLLGDLMAGRAGQLAPWLSDTRWYVVRNVVHILGWMGGDAVAEHVGVAAGHPELRVRREVVATLGQAPHDVSRPLLLGMLDAAEPELFVAILHQLSADPDPAIADRLLERLAEPRFAERAEDERRALFRALATRGEAVVPRLGQALHQSGLFAMRGQADRTAVALCLARIGTAEARAALERGLASKRKDVRRACEIATAAPGGPRE